MKKLALSIAVTGSLLIAGSSVAFGALRVDTGASVLASQRDSSVIVERGGSPHLVYINEMLYPDDFTPLQLGPLTRAARGEDDAPAALLVTSAVEQNGWCDVDCQQYTYLVHYGGIQGQAFQTGSAIAYDNPALCAKAACFLP